MISNYLSNQLTEERKQSAYEVLNECINDSDIQHFLHKYDLADDKEFISRNKSTIMEFVFRRDNDLNYYPILQLRDNALYVAYTYRLETQRIRVANGESAIPKVYYDEITRNFKHVTVTASNSNVNDVAVMNVMNEFMLNYKRNILNQGIWLYGNYGVGKTYLMGYFAKELVQRGIEVRFVSFANLINKLRNKVRTNQDVLEKEIDKLNKVEVLILDDIGAEYPKIWSINTLYDVLDYRMNNKKSTFFTSNYNIHDYLESLNNVEGFNVHKKGQMSERMTVLAKQVQLVGQNRRKK